MKKPDLSNHLFALAISALLVAGEAGNLKNQKKAFDIECSFRELDRRLDRTEEPDEVFAIKKEAAALVEKLRALSVSSVNRESLFDLAEKLK